MSKEERTESTTYLRRKEKVDNNDEIFVKRNIAMLCCSAFFKV